METSQFHHPLHPARKFGTTVEDLEIDFRTDLRAELAATILAGLLAEHDGRPVSKESCLNLPISTRIELLMAVSSEEDDAPLLLQLQCPYESCNQLMELELTLQDIRDIQDKAIPDESIMIADQGFEYHLRRPTGRDQLSWHRQEYPDQETAVQTIIESLMVSVDNHQPPALTSEMVAKLDRCMHENDPLVNLTVSTQCPFCSQEWEHGIDIEQHLLENLRREQARLLKTIHVLASRYHWSETQILAIPEWRRRKYIDMVENEVYS